MIASLCGKARWPGYSASTVGRARTIWMTVDAGPRSWGTLRHTLPAEIGWSWTLAAATLASHLLSYLFQLVMSRSLPASEFGLLNGLMAFSFLLVIPVNTIQLTVARQTAETVVSSGYGQVRRYLRTDLRRTTPIILGGLAAYLVVSPLLASFFHSSLWPIWIVGTISLAALYLPFAEGVLQGLQRFRSLAMTILTRYVGKLGLGALLVLIGMGVEGGLTALLLANAVAALFAFALVSFGSSSAGQRSGASADVGTDYPRDAWPTLVTYACVVLLTNVDVMLARHYLTATDSAHYAIAALLGKIAYYLPGFLIVIMVPKVASARASGRSTRQYLTAGLLATLAASAGVVLVYGLFPQQVISILFGARYASPETATLVLYYSVAMLVLSVLYLEVHYLLASRRTQPLYGLLVGPAVALALMVSRHGTGLELVHALTIGLLVGLLVVNVLAATLRGFAVKA
jgi:O-antigen/teichoic acid export membrane protein